MLRCYLTKCTYRISYKYFAFCFSSDFKNPFHRNVFFNLEHLARCKQNNMSVISWINRFCKELHSSIFEAQMEKAFHLAQWIFLDLFCCSTALKSKFRLDQHRYQLTGTCLMRGADSSVCFQNCGICRAASHIKDSKRKSGSRCCHCSK